MVFPERAELKKIGRCSTAHRKAVFRCPPVRRPGNRKAKWRIQQTLAGVSRRIDAYRGFGNGAGEEERASPVHTDEAGSLSLNHCPTH